ncbi:MAG: glutamate racemase [Bacillota bacterium]
MNNSKKAIGMLDSGVGGLTVAKQIIKTMPAEKIIYFGDTLHLPYGPKPKDEVRSYVDKIIRYFDSRNVKTIILACNTATSMLLKDLRGELNIPLFGTIDGVANTVNKTSENKKVGVIGTQGTINSEAYQDALRNENSNFIIHAKACPEFVGLVENGKFDGSEVKKTIQRYLLPLKEKGIDSLILGCTHYPYLIPVIKKVLGNEIKLINPAETMAEKAKNILAVRGMISGKHEQPIDFDEHEFYVSDLIKLSHEFLDKGTEFLGLPHLNFDELDIFIK